MYFSPEFNLTKKMEKWQDYFYMISSWSYGFAKLLIRKEKMIVLPSNLVYETFHQARKQI